MKSLAWACCAFLALACGSDEDVPSSGSGGSSSGGSAGVSGGGVTSGGSSGTGATTSGGASGNAGTGGAATGGSGGSGGSAGGPSCLTNAQGIAVADVDLDGFPSYSVDDCQLAYVSANDKSLKLRDLTTGNELTIAPSSENPRRPSLAGDVLAWEADVTGKSAVRVRHGGNSETLAGSFDHAVEPRATLDAVVFTGFLGPKADSDCDVFLYTTNDKAQKLVAGGKGQQRFADVSATHVAVSDFSEDPSGVYGGDGTTLANVIVVERATGTPAVRVRPGKQAFPMLGSSGTLSFLEWTTVHPVPKLQEYTIKAVPLAALLGPDVLVASVSSDQAVRPTARAGLAEWVVRSNGKSALWRAALDATTPPKEIALGSVEVIHAPSSTSNMTVLAVRKTVGATPALVAIPR